MVSPSLTLLRTQSDDRLAALARDGHERAFDAIVERYRRPLLRHARRLIGDARAEEAVQQAFLAAWAALGRGDDVRHLSGWLHRIVHNAALNALRGERDDMAELRDWLEGAGAPEEELERREMLRDTLANLAALPERQREALLRVAVDGHSAEEVGSSLGLSEGAVRQLLYRARTALRAAATALTPMPVAGWLARAEPLAARVAELAGGAGTAGLGSMLAKTGVVVVVAGSAAAGPAMLGDDGPRRTREPAAKADTAAPLRETASVPVASTRPVPGPSGRGAPGSSGRGESGSSGRGESGSSGHGSSGSSGSGDPGSSGSSGSSGSGSSGSSGSGDSGSSGSSGSGSSGSSGSGSSGSSGSGTSGSGSSGSSGSGDSGSSGSGTSGSGSSGSSGSGVSGSSGLSGSGSGSSGSGDSSRSSDSSGSGDSGSSGSSGSGDSSGSGSSDD